MGRWINVKKKLPDELEECLVCVKDEIGSSYYLATFIENRFYPFINIKPFYPLIGITHWMYLPLPPKN